MSTWTAAQEALIDPIERMFEREYPGKRCLFSSLPDPTEGGSGFADIAYIHSGPEQLHVVRLEATFDDCILDTKSGIHTMSWIESNYKWLALPLDEFRNGEELFGDMLMDLCKERGVGILCVQAQGTGLSAKVMLDAAHHKGRYIKEYDLTNPWKDSVRSPYRVVS